MKRIFHPYEKWEDYEVGFYDNCSGKQKEEKMLKVVEMFKDEELTRFFMMKVIEDWKYSCEQNLTNDSMNKIAYIGQGACCLYASVPSTVTMEAWSLLTQEIKNRSNEIAKEVLSIWITKNSELCQNID